MKNNRFFRILFTLYLTCIMILAVTPVEAATDNFWTQASGWYAQGSTNTYLDTTVISDLASMVEVVGTAVIAIATVVLGIRYMLGSVTEKADVKENMITLLVACIFFFGWSNLRTILIKGVTFDSSGAVTSINGSSTFFALEGGATLEQAFASIFAVVILIAKVIAVVCTIYMGVKYIFSGAEGKAKLKSKGVMYIVGIILIFTTLNILSFISTSINTALK